MNPRAISVETRPTLKHTPEGKCPFAHAIYDEPTVTKEELQYGVKVIEKLVEMADEEFGDTLPSFAHALYDEVKIDDWFLPAGIPENRAYPIVNGAIECAQRRYLGQCALHECDARKAMTHKIAELQGEV